ncbi:benzoylformate decarboxylase [Psychrobacter sp. LV10R520-6]|uniref:benzoylformate decarboxylase n=1 Tax=Psychrobacter sp. LV10R520-6 TaxID=1415574 RepID=UPI0024C82A7A|nr:benzoylformate decarboxylase [Psychrobacter sp. LV10R520-6]SNT70456.1 benzoylformate decarboxylase [Psychrobacter sp. LV10R520-6]
MSHTEHSNTSNTVQQITFRLMRELNMTKVFGNPGSTELNFLNDFPEDFDYVLALQEASAVAMADGYAQATGNAAFVNLHSAAGVGHALGNIFTAFRNHAPLVITAGQQSRSILPFAPYLGAERAAEFPKPYVKWSIEPARPEDVPLAIAQAYHIAMQHPRGPTFVSIPSDDWDKVTVMPHYSKVIEGTTPSPAAIDQLLKALQPSQNLALVVGSDVDRQGAFETIITLAERLQAQVWEAPYSSRASFPQNHPQFAGFLSALPEHLSQKLAEYDVILVIGAPVFTLHLPGDMPLFNSDVAIYQITDDPMYAASASATTTLFGTIAHSIQALLDRLDPLPSNNADISATPIRPAAPQVNAATPIPVEYAIDVLSHARPADAIIVEEAPSHRPAIQRFLPIIQANGFYTMASGGLGYALPAAVGVALATDKRVICVIGDGSSMYSIQAIWTAVQLNLPVTVIVFNNSGYGAMHSFSKIMKNKSIPGLDLPDIDFVQLAKSMGCNGSRVSQHEQLAEAINTALDAPSSYLLEIIVDPNTRAIY